MSSETKKVTSDDIDILAEDDEFEEFQQETWDEKEEAQEDEQLWEDNWDDDDVDDTFSAQLRQELEKNEAAPMKS